MNNESILSKLFPGRVIIPKEVYDELSHPGVNRVKGLKAQVDIMVQSGAATIETIVVGTNTYRLYRKLTNSPDPGHRVIGRGEAASISLAKERNGILASNNLKDISVYRQPQKNLLYDTALWIAPHQKLMTVISFFTVCPRNHLQETISFGVSPFPSSSSMPAISEKVLMENATSIFLPI